MYIDICISFAICLGSFVAGLTTRRSRRLFTRAPEIIICLLGLSQGCTFHYFKSSKSKKYSIPIIFLVCYVFGRSLQMVGLTGGISCGKSTIVSLVRENFNNFAIIDCDQIAREVVRPGRRAYKQIISAFGQSILLFDKTINRERLGEIIFDDKNARKKLDRIIQPIIFWEILKSVVMFKIKGFDFVLLDAPLLFEAKVLKYFCCPIITVYVSNQDIWIRRLCDRDRIMTHQAKAKIACQMQIEEKVRLSDFSIDNSGSQYVLENNVLDLFRKIQG